MVASLTQAESARGGREPAVSTTASAKIPKETNVTIHQRRGRHHAGYRLASLLRRRQGRHAAWALHALVAAF
jgi:hypothetical protein